MKPSTLPTMNDYDGKSGDVSLMNLKTLCNSSTVHTS